MEALGLYARAFRAEKLYLLYRDIIQSEIEAELKANGTFEACSDDTILDFVDHRTEHLVLMFYDEQRIELLSKRIDPNIIEQVIIPRLTTQLSKWGETSGPLESLSNTAQRLKYFVEQSLLELVNYPLFPTSVPYASGLLKTLAFLASWAPENEITQDHRRLRAELLAKADTIGNRLTPIIRSPALNTESLRKEYVEFVWSCFDLALCRQPKLGRIIPGIGTRLVRPK